MSDQMIKKEIEILSKKELDRTHKKIGISNYGKDSKY